MPRLRHFVRPAQTAALLLSVFLLCVSLYAQTAAPPLALTGPRTLPQAIIRTQYSFQLNAAGGLRPLTWSVDSGSMPPGLILDPATGMISGVPHAVGVFNFEIRVADSSTPAKVVRRKFSIQVIAAIALRWSRTPAVNQDRIDGALDMFNQTPDQMDLTLIVVAVNEIGKAFVLGYQHFTFASADNQDIPFGATLPRGTYFVRADAIGEVPEKYRIYRDALQTNPMQIP